MMMRLQKFLSRAGVCSRRKGETYIAEGRVAVNGETVTSPGCKVDEEKDRVTVDNRTVDFSPEKKNLYIALNKPAGYVSSCHHRGEKIVLDLVDLPDRVYPVGRLDRDSTGLILLTNDGDLHNRLSHPSHNHEKEYLVETGQPVSRRDLARMAEGIVLDGKKTRRAEVAAVSGHRFKIVLKQGLNRQIRRMVQKCNNRVKTLKRVRMGTIRLGRLEQGKWRHLTPKEVSFLKQEANDKSKR
ncbi:MAG: pseudouridine synthase [Desulfobacteraceae bacterium]